MSHFQGEIQENGVSLGISVSQAGRWGAGLPFFDVLGLFAVCQRCVGGGRKLWVRMDVISLGWELSRGILCLVNALQGHRGAGQAPAAAFWFFWLLLELVFLSSNALCVCCQTSTFLPVLGKHFVYSWCCVTVAVPFQCYVVLILMPLIMVTLF